MKLGLAALCFTLLIASSYGMKCKNVLGEKECKTNMKNNPVYCESHEARFCQRSCDLCDNYCYIGDYTDYEGTVSHTVNGLECQRWDSQTPHAHTIGDQPSDFVDGFLPDNYCRGVSGDSESEPWCYTTDPNTRFGYCGITKCASSRNLRGKVADLTSSFNQQQTEMAEFKQQVQTEMAELKQQVQTEADQVAELKQQVQNLSTKNDDDVFFTAVLTKGSVTLSIGETLVYNTVHNNIGNGYNTVTGVFTSPLDGYYQFNVYMLSQANLRSRLAIFVNGKETVSLFANASYGWQSGSNSAIYLLRKNDVVEVKATLISAIWAPNPTKDLMNTFSGFLLTVL